MTQTAGGRVDARSGEATWARWGVAAGVVGMLSWVAGVAMIPLDAKLQYGAAHLAQVLREHAPRLYVAALLAVTGGVLLVANFAVLVRLTPAGAARWGLLHVIVMFTVDQQGPFALDGPVGTLAPVMTILWILAPSATLPAQARRRAGLVP